MKIIITVICFLALMNNLSAQKIEGKYSEDSDYMKFQDDSVDFKIKSNGGLVIDLKGTGTYNVTDGFLLIKTNNFNGLHSHFEKTKDANGLLTFTILDLANKPINGVNVTLTDNKNNFLYGTVTNDMGQATIANNDNAAKINFSLVGYDTYSIEYSGDYNFKVNLMDYQIIENSTIVFKINSLKPDTLNLVLISTNFLGNAAKGNDLVKLEKKSQKYKYRERVLTK